MNLQGIPPFQDRIHDGMIACMIQAQVDDNIDVLQGHRGTTGLMLVDHLDLHDGQAVDDLHQDHEGSAADLTELLLTTPEARTVVDMSYAVIFFLFKALSNSRSILQGVRCDILSNYLGIADHAGSIHVVLLL